MEARKIRSTVMSAPDLLPHTSSNFAAESASELKLNALLLFLQHQVASLADHALRCVGKAREQPRQRNLKAHARFIYIDSAGRALPECGDPEGQPVVGPNLFLKRQ